MIQTDSKRKRLTVAQVAAVIRCIVRDDQAKNLTIDWKSCAIGDHQHTNLEFSAVGYYLSFGIVRGQLSQCQICLTPGGSEWSFQTDGGSPSSQLDQGDFNALVELLSESEQIGKIGVKPVFIVVVGHGSDREHRVTAGLYERGPQLDGIHFPSELNGTGIFETAEEAQVAADKFTAFMDAQNKRRGGQKKATQQREAGGR